MKTLILYSSKYGATREIAQRIANEIDDAVICDLKQNNIPSLNLFECVIIGSPLYVGMIRKEVKAFISRNAQALQEKNLGLYLSGMDESKEKTYFDTNFPREILQTATAKSFLGGIFDPQKAGIIARFIMKTVAKKTEYTNTITDEKIEGFTKTVKS